MSPEGIDVRRGSGRKSAYIGGTRVRVSDIVRLYIRLRAEPLNERILASLPYLTLAQIDEALEYWASHGDEIESEIAEEDRIAESIPPM